MLDIPAGHEKPCALCGDACNALAGNPSLWPVAIPLQGAMRYCHSGCIAMKLAMQAEEIKTLKLEVERLAGDTNAAA